MPYKRNYNKRPKKRMPRRRKFKPRGTTFGKSNMRLANKIEIIRPITLKPKSIMKKFIYYNRAEVINQTQSDSQNCQFFGLRLNSPWIWAQDVNSDVGTNSWRWNNVITAHVNGNGSDTGTSFPGMFNYIHSPGNGYQNACIVGGKMTIQATPLYQPNLGSGSPTALFAQVTTQPSTLTETSTIDDLYLDPFTSLKRVNGGGTNNGDLNGNTKSAKIVINYSPKKYNNIKDIRDNKNFFSHVNAVNGAGTHPSEGDYVTFGLCNILTNGTTQRKCVPVMLELKYTVTVLFTESIDNDQNQYPAFPALNV